jgi:hypothetical protein
MREMRMLEGMTWKPSCVPSAEAVSTALQLATVQLDADATVRETASLPTQSDPMDRSSIFRA